VAEGDSRRVTIGFPVRCLYRGGHDALGRRGRTLRINAGRIGWGAVRLTHSIPLADVVTVEVTERQFGGTQASTLVSFGTRGGGRPARPPKQLTDVTVTTRDGQHALWVVHRRGAPWVCGKLAAVLRSAGIPCEGSG
jgi:hypothetical protein